MFPAKQGKQIIVEVFNELGVLHDLARTVAEKGITILSLDAEVVDKDAVIRLVTDDNLRAADALRDGRYAPTEVPVVLVELPHKPGMLEHLAERLGRAQIDIYRLTVTATPSQGTCLVVLSCSDNDHAVVLLNKE